MFLQDAFGDTKEEVLRAFLKIAQLPEAGQASDKAIPPRSSCRQDQYFLSLLFLTQEEELMYAYVLKNLPKCF